MKREELIKLLENNEETKKEIYIFGTGNTAQLYQEGLSRLEEEGISISGYLDNDKSKWGKKFANDKTIYNPEYLKNNKDVLVLIATPQPVFIKAIGEQLSKLNIKWRHIDDYILKIHKEDVIYCYDMFSDEKSKEVYSELVKCRIKGNYPEKHIVDDNQYFSFSNFSDINENEVFIDCGAYVGDTIERFIWKSDGIFKKIIAFEPDQQNVKAMNYRIERLKNEWNYDEKKFEIYSYGVSDKNSTLYVQRYDANNGLGSKLLAYCTDNNEEIKSVSIDEFVDEQYTFLKADIESYEYKLLIGAKETIKKYSPKLAICIYHNSVDFYQIPLLLKSINPNYKFSVRHYTTGLSDTVLYAYV